MSILAFGLNHQTATVKTRERAAFADDKIQFALQDLMKTGAANEVVILSTCNRTELYTDGHDPIVLTQWLAKTHEMREESLRRCLYFHQNEAAVKHAMRVASGLDSMVLGESQILNQMRTAYSLADSAGAIGSQLGRLFQAVFAVTKQVRTDTGIGTTPVSVAYAAVNLAKHIFADLSKTRVLCLGAGETIELTSMHLANQGVRRLLIAGRDRNKAQALADKFHGHGILLSDVPVYLAQSDIVITATASQLPIVGKGMVERAIKARKHKPMFMMDLAVPRDIEKEVGDLPDVYLYNIDDLRDVIRENLKSRQAAAEQAEAIIDIQVKHYMRELKALDANSTICQFRRQIDRLRVQELDKAITRLKNGHDPEDVLCEYSHALTHKIMHTPTTELRQAAFDDRADLLLLARRLFHL